MRERGLTSPIIAAISTPPGTSGLSAFAQVRHFTGLVMTGTTRSSGGLDDRRKRLLFRCWHRGTREMDLILGQFADAEIGMLSIAEVDELERLIELTDHDLYAAVCGEAPLPPEFHGGLFERVRTYGRMDRDA
jgi:antitoxin CptB